MVVPVLVHPFGKNIVNLVDISFYDVDVFPDRNNICIQ